MKQILKAAAGMFAIIPGIGVLTSGAMTPPDQSKLFGAFIEIVGVGTLLLILLNQKRWASTTGGTSRRAVISGAAAVVFLLLYLMLFSFCVVKVPDRGTTYFPLWTNGDLKKLIEHEGSREAVIEKLGEGGAYELVMHQPSLTRIGTTSILVILMCATTASLVFCFGILAARLQTDFPKGLDIKPGGH